MLQVFSVSLSIITKVSTAAKKNRRGVWLVVKQGKMIHYFFAVLLSRFRVKANIMCVLLSPVKVQLVYTKKNSQNRRWQLLFGWFLP